MTAQQIEQPEALSVVVARRVRGLLAEMRMTQAALAAALGISQAAMSDRLRGVKDFDLNELPALAQVLHTSEQYLLAFTDERSPRRSAPGGGSFFVMPERSSGALRACRDSNPKPSDLWSTVRRLVAKLGHLIAGGDRTAVQTTSTQGGEDAGAVIIEWPLARIQAGELPDGPAQERTGRAHLTVVS